jgi:hypothetical protein
VVAALSKHQHTMVEVHPHPKSHAKGQQDYGLVLNRFKEEMNWAFFEMPSQSGSRWFLVSATRNTTGGQMLAGCLVNSLPPVLHSMISGAVAGG